MRNKITVLLSVLALVFATACSSSSSGSGSASDSGNITIEISPSLLRVGTIGFLNINFSNILFDDIEDQGMNLKILLPRALQYVTGTATFVKDDGALSITPIFAGSDTTDENFIVISLPGSNFEDDQNSGSIQIHVTATRESDGAVVAADLDRGTIGTFDVENTSFDEEAVAVIPVLEANNDD